ncbi:hypothetical protein [Halobacteriovorax sp. DPLXC-1]|uniref:hypothetical protein n=1 Tax=Halobacteriovorax sp. DPLXC-1 TaxID=3110771 RepID=UPI002FEFE59B
MKNLVMALVCAFSLNANAGITIGFPGDISFPDMRDIEESQRIFQEAVETLIESEEVASVVSKVEQGHRSTCVALEDKASRGLIWFKLRYRCEGERDFTLTVKSRLKKDSIIVKEYKIKL